MLSTLSVFAFLLLLLPARQDPALAQEIEGKALSELLNRWPNAYVRWIITEEEQALYRALKSAPEKLQFIEQFWARRDPTPETLENEYRAEYLQRFAHVPLRKCDPGEYTLRVRVTDQVSGQTAEQESKFTVRSSDHAK